MRVRAKWMATMVSMILILGLLAGCTSTTSVSTTPTQAPAAPAKPQPGVTATEIKLGVSTILSGAVAFAGKAGDAAVIAYYSNLNESGGINGRKFTWVVEDNRYEPQAAVASVKKLITRDAVFAIPISFGTATTVAVKDLVTEEKVPTLSVGGADPIFTPPSHYLFMAGTPYTWQAAVAAEYIATTLQGQQNKSKLALIYQDDDMGKAFLEGVTKTAEHFGMSLVASVPIARGSTDASAQVAAVAAKNPDYILAGTILADTASILREVRKLGLQARVVGTGQPSMHAKLIELAGADAVKDYIGFKDFAAWTDDVPGMVEMTKVATKYAPEMAKEQNDYFVTSWVNSMLLAEAIKRAGTDLTRDRVTQELSNLANFDTGGLTGPVTFGAEKRFSGTGARAYKINLQTNTVEAISDWMKPTVYTKK